ncbi:MAG: glycosyltransferase family 2 protein [Candidatus Omnitrophica bacterium]|nr:glycosyltransferase family 2 protein [Candidatus Omnitrophota bacterium]
MVSKNFSHHNLSVVIPAYNEELIIEKTIRELDDYLHLKFVNYEIIVVDDGSNDNTFELCNSLAKNIPYLSVVKNQQNQGKGYSVRKGMQESKYNQILFTDADMSTPITEVEKALILFDQGWDVVIGSRAMKESNIVKRQVWYRQAMGRIFNILVRLFFRTAIRDTQCGFKLFSQEKVKSILALQRIDRFCFDVELLFLLKKLGCKIVEMPVIWANREDSKVKVVSSSLDMFGGLFTVLWNDWTGKYKI